MPWWTLPAIRISFWRPITALSHWLDYLLWPHNSVLMHLQSLFWFGALAAAAAFLYRRLFGPAWVAGLTALFFALDDAHGLDHDRSFTSVRQASEVPGRARS